MALPLDPGQIPAPKPFGGLPTPPGGSPFNSGNRMQTGPSAPGAVLIPGQPISQNPSENPFPFYNTDTTQGIPSPLTPSAQAQYGLQSTGFSSGSPSGGSTGDDLYNSLIQQLAGISNGGADIASLTALANQEAGLKYDPLISQLQGNLTTAQNNEATASKNIGGLYDSLGKGLAAQIPGITQQYAAQQNQSQQDYANLQNQIQNNYQGAQQAQQAELEKLGIQAALPQSTQELNLDQAYQQSQASNNGQALQAAIVKWARASRTFSRGPPQLLR